MPWICKNSTLIEALIVLMKIILHRWLIKVSNILYIKDISLILRVKSWESLAYIFPNKVLVSHRVFVLANKNSICLTTFISIFPKFSNMLFYLYLSSEMAWVSSNSKMCFNKKNNVNASPRGQVYDFQDLI